MGNLLFAAWLAILHPDKNKCVKCHRFGGKFFARKSGPCGAVL